MSTSPPNAYNRIADDQWMNVLKSSGTPTTHIDMRQEAALKLSGGYLEPSDLDNAGSSQTKARSNHILEHNLHGFLEDAPKNQIKLGNGSIFRRSRIHTSTFLSILASPPDLTHL
jgi:hypothetical protein